MRKIALTLSLLLLLALTACSSEPYDVLRAALDQTAALESAAFDFTTTVGLEAGDYSDFFVSEGTLRRSGGVEAPVCAVTLRANGVESSLYYADGVLYTDNGAEQFRTRPEDDQLQELLNAGSILDLTEDSFRDLSLSEEDGVTTLTGTLSSEALSQLAESALSSLGLDLQSFTWSDATLTATLSEGYVISQVMEYALTAEMDGTEGCITVKNEVRCLDPGQPVTVDAPEDLAAYPEA